MKLVVVVGTRPEVIKMAPVLRLLEELKIDHILIHSNQHYSSNMDEIFFEELELKKPDYNLNVGSGLHGNQTGNILIKIEPILEKEKPDVLLTQGDTNTVVAAALAASKLGIKVAHVEAGLRSYDKRMPEETNRVITDHVSDYLFAVTNKQEEILLGEGVSKDKIHVVGNTICDTLIQNLKIAETKSEILKKYNLESKNYNLFTSHRAENVDRKSSLEEIMSIVEYLERERKEKLVWPVHPRTLKKIEEYGFQIPENVVTMEPIGYLDFITLEKNASFIITDSGGLQEEACILGVPCITIRDNTERPESVMVGANKLVGRDLEKLIEAIQYFESKQSAWENPFGEGKTSELIIKKITGRSRTKEKVSQRISVIGLGYMGLPTAALLSKAGHQVSGFDVSSEKVELINSKKLNFENEPNLNEMVHEAIDKNQFIASTELKPADIYLIAVPTPKKDQKCDLSYVLSACESIAKVASNNEIVIIESTIKPGTSENIVENFFKEKSLNLNIAHCPERAIPGNTLFELVHNDRIIGCNDQKTTKIIHELYSGFVLGKIHHADLKTAETVKLLENTFRDINIAYANEIAGLGESLGIDIHKAIELANRHPRVNILTPGPGVGGHCIAVDPWFLIEDYDQSKLIKAARSVNDQRPINIAKKSIEQLKDLKGNKIGLLGLAYKKNVGDCRETPAKTILDVLREENIEVSAHDPYVEKWEDVELKKFDDLQNWSDLMIVVTDHDVFKEYSLKKPFIDTRNLYQQS